jgi:hypothetical protein
MIVNFAFWVIYAYLLALPCFFFYTGYTIIGCISIGVAFVWLYLVHMLVHLTSKQSQRK